MEQLDLVDIVFDATTAYAHEVHSDVLTAAGKKVIDLTPAAIGPFTVPTVNLKSILNQQMSIWLHVVDKQQFQSFMLLIELYHVEYAEIVATVASKSAGPGTRANIDEFTHTTSRAIEEVGGAEKGKAIIILNPAEPPVIMRDTVHALVKEEST